MILKDLNKPPIVYNLGAKKRRMEELETILIDNPIVISKEMKSKLIEFKYKIQYNTYNIEIYYTGIDHILNKFIPLIDIDVRLCLEDKRFQICDLDIYMKDQFIRDNDEKIYKYLSDILVPILHNRKVQFIFDNQEVEYDGIDKAYNIITKNSDLADNLILNFNAKDKKDKSEELSDNITDVPETDTLNSKLAYLIKKSIAKYIRVNISKLHISKIDEFVYQISLIYKYTHIEIGTIVDDINSIESGYKFTISPSCFYILPKIYKIEYDDQIKMENELNKIIKQSGMIF